MLKQGPWDEDTIALAKRVDSFQRQLLPGMDHVGTKYNITYHRSDLGLAVWYALEVAQNFDYRREFTEAEFGEGGCKGNSLHYVL